MLSECLRSMGHVPTVHLILVRQLLVVGALNLVKVFNVRASAHVSMAYGVKVGSGVGGCVRLHFRLPLSRFASEPPKPKPI